MQTSNISTLIPARFNNSQNYSNPDSSGKNSNSAAFSPKIDYLRDPITNAKSGAYTGGLWGVIYGLLQGNTGTDGVKPTVLQRLDTVFKYALIGAVGFAAVNYVFIKIMNYFENKKKSQNIN